MRDEPQEIPWNGPWLSPLVHDRASARIWLKHGIGHAIIDVCTQASL
ncbi:hypothetical protein FBPa19_0078 [Pseudomonas phage vB_PaeP_FBPa19]|nr:hypothetical protein FBPa19_0078 [Pseudomonas phage vB_PaeP_FBPa19]